MTKIYNLIEILCWIMIATYSLTTGRYDGLILVVLSLPMYICCYCNKRKDKERLYFSLLLLVIYAADANMFILEYLPNANYLYLLVFINCFALFLCLLYSNFFIMLMRISLCLIKVVFKNYLVNSGKFKKFEEKNHKDYRVMYKNKILMPSYIAVLGLSGQVCWLMFYLNNISYIFFICLTCIFSTFALITFFIWYKKINQ